jgi:Tfp pilus assembly protein PilW
MLELIIAVAIAIVLSLIIYSVVISQSRAYGIQDQMTLVQQNLRFGMDFISRNLAMAGYGTNGTTLVDTGIDSSGMLLAIRGLDGGSGASDVLQVIYADPTNLAMTAWSTDQACGTTSLSFQNTTDASLFSSASYMICFDYSDSSRMKSFMFKVKTVDTATGVVGIETPTNNTAYYSVSGQCPSTGNLPRDLQCGPAQVLTFYIDRNSADKIGPGSSTHPVLMMSSAVAAFSGTGVSPTSSDTALADNIEDLQVQVCSTDATDTVTCAATADWTNWSASLNNATAVDSVRQVKVTLWARSDKKNPEGKNSVSAPNPLTGARDGYFRQMESTTVLVRNLRLLEDYN